MQTIFFTSDEHHGHRNALTGWGNVVKARPFGSLEEMTEGLIQRHNAKVKPGDLVYHLGDMFWRTFGPVAAVQVMKRLKGQHFYVWGNHEEVFEGAEGLELGARFVWRRERMKIKPAGGPKDGIVLDHFAGRVWHQSHKGAWQLYGHSHGELPDDPRLLSMDVGVDAPGINYEPVSVEEVRVMMRDKIARFDQRKADEARP